MHVFTIANGHFVALGGDLAYDNETAAAQAIGLVSADITRARRRQECNDIELWS
jgi:hypothetical protein